MSDRMTDGANALLNQTSAQGIKWADIGQGVWVRGKVKDHDMQQCTKWDAKNEKWTDEPDCWDDGKPKMQIVVDWMTDLRDPSNEDDDGRRTLRSGAYKKPGTIIGAIREAVTAAGAPGLEHGADLALMWQSGEGRSGDPRQFIAAYKRPVTPVPGNGAPAGDPFASSSPQQAAAPQPAPALQPAAAPAW